MKKTSALIFLISLLFVNFAFTVAEAARVDRRQRHQRARIRQGVKTGKIDSAERKELRKEQKAIKEKKREMRQDDGHLDASERQELRQDQDAASQNIYEEKND